MIRLRKHYGVYSDNEMSKNKVIHFVLHGSERALQPDSLSVVNYYSLFLSFIAMMAGVLLGGTYLALALFMAVLSLLYILTTEVLKRKLKNSLQTGFICNSLVSVFSMVFFAVFGVLCFIMLSPNKAAAHAGLGAGGMAVGAAIGSVIPVGGTIVGGIIDLGIGTLAGMHLRCRI